MRSLENILLCVSFFMIIFTVFPGTICAEQNGLSIKALIENIRYEGKDVYSLVVLTSNSLPSDVRVKIVEEGFFIQTDRGWHQLQVQQKDSKIGELVLAALGKYERTARIRIPLTVPQLFRTYEGDLSLAYRYRYKIQTLKGTGESSERADEVYCWIKPGTSDWILREGM